MFMNLRSDQMFDATVTNPTSTSTEKPVADRGVEIRSIRVF
jgi:hypothetical protein